MARHFCIATKSKRTRYISLRLHSDLVGSSLWDLRHVIHHIAGRYEGVAIQTGRLPNINRLGLELIAAQWAGRTEMVFTGPFQPAFSMA